MMMVCLTAQDTQGTLKTKMNRLFQRRTHWILTLTIVTVLATGAAAYKPVVIIHGILDEPHSLDTLSGYITKYHPGTNVTKIDLCHGWHSIVPMWDQVRAFGKVVINIIKENKKGIHIIGYSQGGLVARGILSTFNHNVDTFISLSSPQMGQYGATSYFKWFFPKYTTSDLYKVLYTKYGQRISLGNYWNDPHHQDLYKKFSIYLTVLNNDTYNPSSYEMKKNFMRLNRLVLIGGPDDGVITPWQSSHFGFYNEKEIVEDITDQKVFKEDSFGLKTLFKSKKVMTYSVPGVEHLQWHSNETVFKTCMLPWLT